ncbi:hypothetical protein FRC15_000585 [Serendipita sp. 397]|nr:hypothetical protein FRC15_000585 [Serendipita sp. 397]
MASRGPHTMDGTNLRNNNGSMDMNQDEEVMFNPAEHKDLAHFFSHVDHSETFALTANEWLGIRSGGQQFNPVGSVGPAPATPNRSLMNATRSLMAMNTPVISSNSPSATGSGNSPNGTPTASGGGGGSGAAAAGSSSSSSLPSTSPVTTTSIRAWRPHETPFDPSVHGRNQHQPQHHHQHQHHHDHDLVRRSSSASSSNITTSHRRGGGGGGGNGDRSSEETGPRKRPAHVVHADSLPSKRARSVSHSTQQQQQLVSQSLPNLLASTSTASGSQTQPSSTTGASNSTNSMNAVAGPSSSSSANSNSNSNSTTKPPLLTAQQKKANHILSEQKRRAKIRRGYDALCEVVPALRSAVLAELEASDSKKKRGKAKGSSAVAAAAAAANDDGRAGPKSESVVLSQTIEYIEGLLARKEELLARLHSTQTTLPPGQRHPLNPENGLPVWEKEWDGGTGMEEGDNDEDEDEDEEDEDTA